MRVVEIMKRKKWRKPIGKFMRLRKSNGKDRRILSGKDSEWLVKEVGPNYQLSPRILSKKHSEWRVKGAGPNYQLSPAPYNESRLIERAAENLLSLASDWKVLEISEPLDSTSPVKIGDGGPSNNAFLFRIEDLDPMEQSSQLPGVQSIFFEESDSNSEIQETGNYTFNDLDDDYVYNESTCDTELNEKRPTDLEGDYVYNESTCDTELNEKRAEVAYLSDYGTKNTEEFDKKSTHEVDDNNVEPVSEDEYQEENIKTIITSLREDHETLDEGSRKELIRRIIHFVFEGERPIKPNYEKIAAAICVVYRCENKDVYYNGRTGKLYDAYNKRLGQLRLNGVLPKSTRALNKMRKLQEMQEPENIDISDHVRESIEYLREEHENYDSDECMYHWSNSFDYRQFVFKNSNRDLSLLWSQWKPLERGWSYMLLCEDFEKMYGTECSERLTKNWRSTFDEEKIKLINDTVKDSYTKQNANKLPGSEECKNITLVNYINAILFPPLLKKGWRPSISDAQKSVILITDSIGDASTKITDRLDVCNVKGMEPHPFICALGPINAAQDINKFMVVFGETRYYFEHLTDALDVCFKMFIVLRIQFPLESTQFYIFLNELFYKLNLNLKRSSKVITLTQKICS